MNKRDNNVMHLPVLVEQDEDEVYIVSCPVYKGCHSYGKTIDEAMTNLKEVVAICVEEEGEKYNVKNRFIGFREVQIPVNETIP
ncbi:MAG TPA: type II toxin-antitoxin system HicB family antitoxin [Prolixibacteraceae bacterium]|nr:type II toxin-antitoxin system HicB family antitoxin [Prolixibacteraceae bacterium]